MHAVLFKIPGLRLWLVFEHEPATVMTEDMHDAKPAQHEAIVEATVSLARCPLKTFLIIAAFVAMTIAPAFAALNIFTEKNRL